MTTKKAQSKAGTPANRRGQQMGDDKTNSPNKLSAAKQNTPALRGRRKAANKFFADDSQQAVGGPHQRKEGQIRRQENLKKTTSAKGKNEIGRAKKSLRASRRMTGVLTLA